MNKNEDRFLQKTLHISFKTHARLISHYSSLQDHDIKEGTKGRWDRDRRSWAGNGIDLGE